jgi:hypothetical protein
MKEKQQTPAQRVANPVWLRGQIAQHVKNCDDSIAIDQKLADKACDDKRALYLARVESHRYWKRTLERILHGKTFDEELRDAGALAHFELPTRTLR